MLVLNSEGEPLDPSQQNVSSDQLLNVGITKDMDCIHEIPIPELNNEAPGDPSQQNVSYDQLLTVGIKKDISCLPEIPMLVLNNEGAPSDSPQQNVSSDQLLNVGITKDMDCIHEIPIPELNNEAMSALTNFSLVSAPEPLFDDDYVSTSSAESRLSAVSDEVNSTLFGEIRFSSHNALAIYDSLTLFTVEANDMNKLQYG
ncbi:uncharacterized protein [Diadema antillarum]|uniref:uncharacterized protein n=1 Tax=Diadema antillarum TaxID=105358 RepID=UPI003A85A853